MSNELVTDKQEEGLTPGKEGRRRPAPRWATSRGRYRLLQWVALILLPALAVLLHGLAELYVWPARSTQRLVGTLNLVGVFLGAVLQGWQRPQQRRQTRQRPARSAQPGAGTGTEAEDDTP